MSMRVLRCNFVLLSILLTTCAQAEDPVILSGDGVTLVIREMQGQGISGDIQIDGKTYPFRHPARNKLPGLRLDHETPFR